MPSQLFNYQKDVINSARDNTIWLNALRCVKPTKEFKEILGNMVLEWLEDRERLIDACRTGTRLDELKQKELILRIGKS